ncbi:MAG: MFS transporter [Planctomycetes bacterium]|nr:MFS transporter [Planctomycetota bacterium]
MSDRPTNVRWRIVGLLLAYAALVHFNRISIAVAGSERLMEQFNISERLMGVLSSAYLLTYTLLMTPGGWFIDRFGARASLLLVGFGSALCVGLCGGAGFTIASAALMVPALISIRLVMGVTNTPFHPAAAHAVAKWIPGPQRAAANGYVNAAALVGISSTYYLFGFMMDRLGWPAAFVTAAAVTGLVAAAWWAYAASSPAEHRGVNDAERRLIAVDASGKIAAARISLVAPWRKRSVMLLTLSYAAVGYFQYMFFYWMQYYFDKVLGAGKSDSRLYATIPAVAMALGMAAGGWLTDRAQTGWGLRRGRAGVVVAGMIASAALLGAGVLCKNTAWIVTYFSLALAALGACEGAFWTTATDLGGDRSGLAAGIVNTGGNAGGALAPILTPIASEHFGWKGAIALACVYCFLGALFWIWIDPDEGFEKPGLSSPPAESLRDGVSPTAVS